MPGFYRYVAEYSSAEAVEQPHEPKNKKYLFAEECVTNGKIIDIEYDMLTDTMRQITIEFQDSATRDWWHDIICSLPDSDGPDIIINTYNPTLF